MKIRISALAIAAAAAAGFFWWRVSTADERAVKRAFRELSALAEKAGPDVNPVLAALDASRLRKLLAPSVEFSAPELRGRSWTESRDEIVRQAFAAKARAARLSLAFEDVDVSFPSPGRATAIGEATLSGSLPEFGGSFDGTREFSVSFRRDASGDWRATRVAAAPGAAK